MRPPRRVCWMLLVPLALSACSEPDLPATAIEPVVLDGDALFQIACAGCHRIEALGPHDVGPNLYGMLGQPAATRAGYAYSPALQAAALHWDRASLAAWIAATDMLVPGTRMSYANILSGEEVARLLDHLLEQTAATAMP